MEKNLVIGLGEALWDVLPSGKKMGGAPANFAYHVSQFGIDSIAVSALGDDELGKELLEKYSAAGLNVNMQTVGFPTGTVQVSVDEKGIPSYDICQGVAWDNISWTPELEKLASQASVVCYGSLAQRNACSRNTIMRFLETMPEGSLKVFDINIRQNYYSRDLIHQNLQICNILKINDEEILLLAGLFGWDETDIREIAGKILGLYSLKMLILTCGAVGSYVFYDGKVSVMDTPAVEVKDTVGAGDSFTGAFIAAILAGKSVPEAHALAVKVSAYVCTCDGAMPVIPDELKY